MSKPITSVAVMMLVEEGKIDLAAPVSQFLPEFNDLRVRTERAPVKRRMTVQDTSGLAYWFSAEDPSIKQAHKGRLGVTGNLENRVPFKCYLIYNTLVLQHQEA